MNDARMFSWKRFGRLLAVTFSILWLASLHHFVVYVEPLRVPFRVKLTDSLIGVAAVFVVFLCIRGRGRYPLGALFLSLAIWTLWRYWRM
jgi:hypothetical protein